MLTTKDIDLMKSIFLTKNEFMIEMADHPTNQDFTDFKHDINNDLLTFKDEIFTEIKDLRQETTINSSFRDRIEKQDERLDHLESAVFN